MRRKPVRRPGVALALRRRPRLRAALTVAIALLCGVSVATTVERAEQARKAWGATRPVLVATEDLEAGERLGTGNTRVLQHPAALASPDALDAVPADGRVTAPVLAGEVVREERLAAVGASPVAARLPPGTRAMAIPVEPGTTPPLAVGDRVEVLVALPVEVAGAGPPGFALTSPVPVVEVSDTAVTIAVERDVAPRLAVAFGQGAVTLALVG
jgi:Flp pilus assembly protein CpaB